MEERMEVFNECGKKAETGEVEDEEERGAVGKHAKEEGCPRCPV